MWVKLTTWNWPLQHLPCFKFFFDDNPRTFLWGRCFFFFFTFTALWTLWMLNAQHHCFPYCYRKRPQRTNTSLSLTLFYFPVISCYFILEYSWGILHCVYPIFVYSSVLLQLACFLVLASGTEIKGYPCPLIFRFSLDLFLGIGLLGPKVLLYYFSNEPAYCSPYWMYLCTLWRTVQESFLVCTPSPALLFVECLTMAVLTRVMWYLTVI